MQAKALPLESLLERKRFEVPSFQRDYCWGKKEWDSLWSDLMDLYEHSRPHNHFMGPIVTMVSDIEQSTFTLLDGQQRIITLVLVLLILMRRSDKSNEKAIKNLLEDNEGYKLKLSSNDNDAFVSLMESDNRQQGPPPNRSCISLFSSQDRGTTIEISKIIESYKIEIVFCFGCTRSPRQSVQGFRDIKCDGKDAF